MESKVFSQSAELVKQLGQMRLSSGQTLAQSLRMGDVSLWDVVTPYLALYRLPKLISSEGQILQLPWWRRAWDLYRSSVRRPREELLNPTAGDGKDCINWPEDNPSVVFLNFPPHFYRETFQPVAEYLVKEHGVSTTILSIVPPAPDAISKFPIRFHTISGHADSVVRARIAQFSMELQQIRKVLHNESPQITFLNGDPIGTALRSEINCLLHFEFPRLVRHLAIA
ncbi:MAG: hypothetical protein NTW69_00050, partial [Chloroflexi bacterium]|nr:hypothetical protein [Chloroflexota bacterium]